MATLYEILEVSRSASSETIEAAYRSLMSRYNGDAVASLGSEARGNAARKTEQLDRAYGILSDPVARAAYDGQHDHSEAPRLANDQRNDTEPFLSDWTTNKFILYGLGAGFVSAVFVNEFDGVTGGELLSGVSPARAMQFWPGLVFGIIFGIILYRRDILPARKAILFAVSSGIANYMATGLYVVLFNDIDDDDIVTRFLFGGISGALGGAALAMIFNALLIDKFKAILQRRNTVKVATTVGTLCGAFGLMVLAPHWGPFKPIPFYCLWQGLYAGTLFSGFSKIRSAQPS